MDPLARVSRVHEDFITVHGWTVQSRTAPIVHSKVMDEYSEQLGGVLTLPEILFGNSSLQLRHDASGIVLSFSAFDALKQWKADDLPPLKVNVAKEWQAARVHEIEKQQAVVLEYDWTYTTSYSGSLSTCSYPLANFTEQQQQQEHQQLSKSGDAQPLAAIAAAAAAAAAAAVSPGSHSSIRSGVGPCQQPPGGSSSSSSPFLPQWQPTSTQIDRQMLMSKNEPILFYAEVPLYESELDDHGVCQLTVKVRVMPRCWLVLLRFWLRVDGCLVRLREVRHFCRLDTPQQVVTRETKHFEGTWKQLAAAGAPVAVSGYEDADSAANVFSAIAPQCLAKFELHQLELPVAAAAAAVNGPACV